MISVVIPSYNRRDGMLALLNDVSLQKGVDYEIIVVDDQSTDDSVEAIRNAFPDVRLFVNGKNGGPAVTRNYGIKQAKGDIIVGFDSDVTVPDSSCLLKVEQTFNSMPNAAGLSFRLLQPDGISEDAARWWHPVPLDQFADKGFETNYFSGTGYAFRTETVREAGMYPEILYMHYEEVELAYRILDLDYNIFYTPDIKVIHHEGQVSRRSEIKMFYKHRNQILLAISCFPLTTGVKYLTPRILYALASSIKGRYFGTFIEMVKSAYVLGRIRLKTRQPLKKQTLQRIHSMKHQ